VSTEVRDSVLLHTADCVKARLYIAQQQGVDQDVIDALDTELKALRTDAESLLEEDVWNEAKHTLDNIHPTKQCYFYGQKLANTTTRVSNNISFCASAYSFND
jgi:hypothetical protein